MHWTWPWIFSMVIHVILWCIAYLLVGGLATNSIYNYANVGNEWQHHLAMPNEDVWTWFPSHHTLQDLDVCVIVFPLLGNFVHCTLRNPPRRLRSIWQKAHNIHEIRNQNSTAWFNWVWPAQIWESDSGNFSDTPIHSERSQVMIVTIWIPNKWGKLSDMEITIASSSTSSWDAFNISISSMTEHLVADD